MDKNTLLKEHMEYFGDCGIRKVFFKKIQNAHIQREDWTGATLK